MLTFRSFAQKSKKHCCFAVESHSIFSPQTEADLTAWSKPSACFERRQKLRGGWQHRVEQNQWKSHQEEEEAIQTAAASVWSGCYWEKFPHREGSPERRDGGVNSTFEVQMSEWPPVRQVTLWWINSMISPAWNWRSHGSLLWGPQGVASSRWGLWVGQVESWKPPPQAQTCQSPVRSEEFWEEKQQKTKKLNRCAPFCSEALTSFACESPLAFLSLL